MKRAFPSLLSIIAITLFTQFSFANTLQPSFSQLNKLDSEQQQRQQQQAENRAEQLDKSSTVRFENNAEKPIPMGI